MEVPAELDLVVIAIPAVNVPSVIDHCLSKNVKAAIIISGGFKEVGEKGKELELEIKTQLKGSNLRIIGPNCIGVFDPGNYIDTLFLPRYRLRRPKQGPIAFISQSGAFGSAVLDWAASQEIGISKFISVGNKIDVDEVDLLQYLADDPQTKCITIYVESINRGREFLNISSKIVKDKPIIILKAGVTDEGANAALSHTGSLAGSAKIYEGAFKQAGILQAQTVDELFDYARTLAYQPLPTEQKNIMIVTNGGGFGVISSDHVSKSNLKLANLTGNSIKKLQAQLPQYAVIGNPLDLVGDADVERYRSTLNIVSADPNVGILLVIVLLQTSYIESDVVDAITEAHVTSGKPIIVCTVGGDFTQILVKMFEENNIPSYSTPERAVNALNSLIYYRKVLERLQKKE
jgi:acyl-CoA synthetase (NDP forming)